MKIEQAKQIAGKAIEELSHALEAGHSEKLREYLGAMARFHPYSLHNIMLIASQRPDATHVAGFHTWKRLGRFVKKGAKGIMILAPVVLRDEAEQERKEESQERAAMRFRAAYVFDMADTDGKPIPQFGSTEGDPAGRTGRLKEFVSSRGIELEYSDSMAPPRPPRGELSQSERDWAFAKRALARGDDPEEIIRRIADYRAEEKHPNYARYTVEKAQAALHRSLGATSGPTERSADTVDLSQDPIKAL
jgi:N-terminal domain of anti-restriction factor ArdC